MTATARGWARLVRCLCAGTALGTVALLIVGAGDHTPGDGSGLGGWGGVSFVVASLAFGGVGALLVARLPANRVGWVFCVTGAALGTNDLAYQYADQTLYGSLNSW